MQGQAGFVSVQTHREMLTFPNGREKGKGWVWLQSVSMGCPGSASAPNPERFEIHHSFLGNTGADISAHWLHSWNVLPEGSSLQYLIVIATDVMLWDCKVQSKKAELEEEVGSASKEGQRGPANFMGFFVNAHLLYEDINLLL